jgi:hypothetical protein
MTTSRRDDISVTAQSPLMATSRRDDTSVTAQSTTYG